MQETESAPPATPIAKVVLAWLVVLAPLAWGVFETLKKAAVLFA